MSGISDYDGTNYRPKRRQVLSGFTAASFGVGLIESLPIRGSARPDPEPQNEIEYVERIRRTEVDGEIVEEEITNKIERIHRGKQPFVEL